jgi:maltooligosyltrehalose trehalohydrolase
LRKEQCDVLGFDNQRVLVLRRWSGNEAAMLALNFNTAAAALPPPVAAGRWRKVLDSSEPRWEGPGSTLPAEFERAESVELRMGPTSAALFVRIT